MTQSAPRPIDTSIEGVRGIAAVMVALSHVLSLNLLTPAFPLPRWLRAIEAGHAGVLLFFILSGYLIGWTNSGTLTVPALRTYARRRFVRLGPIYFLAMILTVGVIRYTGFFESGRVILGSFLGLQNFNGYFGFRLNPPMVNGPLWSLNYELLYYTLFLVLWRYKPRLLWIFGPALVLSILGWFAPSFTPLFIAAYASGWIFWALGWWLSKLPVVAAEESRPIASWIVLIFASHQIEGVMRLLNLLGWYSNDAGMVELADFQMIPVMLLVFAAVSRRRLPGERALSILAWALCIVPAAGMVAAGRLTNHPGWLDGFFELLLALALLPVRSRRWLRWFAGFGAISYAFYVVHFPLLYFVRFLPLPSDTLGGFLERLPIWVLLTLALSWLLERRFQPWIKARLFRARGSPA